MPDIVVLAWDHLVWDPGDLELRDGVWHDDGPSLPVELSFINGERILVHALCRGADLLPVFWAHMGTERVGEAVWSLSQREGSKPENVGFLDLASGESWCRTVDEHLRTIREWALAKNREGEGIGVVVWSDLKPNFEKKFRRELSAENVLQYLRRLRPEHREKALKYLEKTPPQLRTSLWEALRAVGESAWG